MNNDLEQIKEKYEFFKEEYFLDTSEVRKDISTFSIAVIAATWVLIDKEIINQNLLTIATFIFSILSVALTIMGKVFRAKHWFVCFKDKTKTGDYRETKWGKLTQYSWHVLIVSMLFAVLFFIINCFSAM